MIVAGWADGYRNNTFRTVEALGAAGTPWRLLAGPWAHADPASAIPGPRIDLDREMVAWWDRWLRGTAADEWTDRADVFVRTSTVPEPDLELHEGYWVSGPWPPADAGVATYELDGPRSLAVEPDTGVTAWIDCAGHLPWGLSGDQREDDARSLTWEWDAQPTVVGQPLVRLRLSASAPAASLSVKLCDVFPDGTSALITRGSLDLAFRDSSSPAPLVPDEQYDVELLLDACAYRPDPGHLLRLSVAGADWPNTIAPPAPVTLTVHAGSVELPLWAGLGHRAAGVRAGRRQLDRGPDRRHLVGHPRRAPAHHDLRGPQRRVLRRAARGHRAGGLSGRGRGRPPQLRPVGHGRDDVPPHLARRRQASRARSTRRGVAWSRRCGSTSARTATTW